MLPYPSRVFPFGLPGCKVQVSLGSYQSRRVSYPVTTNSNVEDKEQRALSNRAPDVVVVDAAAVDAVELAAVEIPDNALVNPFSGAEVDLQAPSVPVLVGEVDRVANTVALVADTAGVNVTVHGTVADELTVDILHDVKLTTARPGNAVADTVTQHPPRRPDALLAVAAIGAKAQQSLDAGKLAALWCEDVLGLDTARGPAVTLAPWYQLCRVAAAKLDVARVALVGLQLIVHPEVAVNNVPVALVGERATATGKRLLPDSVESSILWSVPGAGEGREGQKRCKCRYLDHDVVSVERDDVYTGVYVYVYANMYR